MCGKKANKVFCRPTDFFKEARRIVSSSVRMMKSKGEWTNIKKETRVGEERRDRNLGLADAEMIGRYPTARNTSKRRLEEKK